MDYEGKEIMSKYLIGGLIIMVSLYVGVWLACLAIYDVLVQPLVVK